MSLPPLMEAVRPTDWTGDVHPTRSTRSYPQGTEVDAGAYGTMQPLIWIRFDATEKPKSAEEPFPFKDPATTTV